MLKGTKKSRRQSEKCREELTIWNSSLEFRDWGCVRADLVFMYEGALLPEFRDCACEAEFLGAWLVLKGWAEIHQEGKVTRAEAGEWLILRQGKGRQLFSEDARIVSVRFQAEWPDREPFFMRGLSAVVRRVEVPKLEKLARRLLSVVKAVAPGVKVDLRFQTMSLVDFIRIRTGFLEWFSELGQVLEKRGIHPTRTELKDERIVRVLHELEEMPLSAQVREERLAGSVGLRAGQFVRVFRREVGTTPKRFFDERKREACREMLANTGTAVKEIALVLGYVRLSDFSAWFSAREGVSPREFRRKVRSQK